MVTIEQLIDRYPKLYHMAECGSWPSIQRHGLLSTTALLDLFEIRGRERDEIECEWRQSSVSINHPIHGTAVVRDQRPMPPHTLAPLLEGLTPREWYQLINRKSFFWVTTDRLNRFLNAAPYRNKTHDVITVDTRALVVSHVGRISLAPFNTGVSSFGPPHRRGMNTFQSVEDYSLEGQNNNVVELAVDYQVLDIADLTISVDQWKGATFQQTIWQP